MKRPLYFENRFQYKPHPAPLIWAMTMMRKRRFIEEQSGSESQFAMFDTCHRHCGDL
jgi:hypothetical protein